MFYLFFFFFSFFSDVLNCLKCLDEFRYFGVYDTPGTTYFSLLFEFMKRFPELSGRIQEHISLLVHEAPAFIDRVTEMIDRVSAALPDNSFPVDTLRTLSQTVYSFDVPQFVSHTRAYVNLLNRISLEKTVDPADTIHFVMRILKHSSVCQQGDWSTGNDLLGLCRTILFNHPTTQVFGPLRNLLTHLMKNFADVGKATLLVSSGFFFFLPMPDPLSSPPVDVRDQARFQYLMLTHVSREKLQSIMAPPSQPLNPQENVSGAFRLNSQIEMEGITIVTPMSYPESQPIQYISNPLLSLLRSQRKAGEKVPSPVRISSKNIEADDLQKLNLLSYLGQLRASSWRPAVLVNVDLKFDDTHFYEGAPQKLFSVTIDFATQTKFVTPVRLKVPYLEKFGEEVSSSDPLSVPERFPFFYRTPVHFQPTTPTPAGFKLMATFTDTDGKTYQGPLDPFLLFFDNLFLPISESVPDVLKDDKLGEVVFSKLWTLIGHLCAPNETKSLSDKATPPASTPSTDPEVEAVLKKYRDLEGYESVKFLDLSLEAVHAILERHLSKFIVSVTSEAGPGDPKVVNTLIFLPPRFHLLLRFQVSANSTIVNIRTDNWRTLANLDSYLDSLRA